MVSCQCKRCGKLLENKSKDDFVFCESCGFEQPDFKHENQEELLLLNEINDLRVNHQFNAALKKCYIK